MFACYCSSFRPLTGNLYSKYEILDKHIDDPKFPSPHGEFIFQIIYPARIERLKIVSVPSRGIYIPNDAELVFSSGEGIEFPSPHGEFIFQII